MSLVRNPRVNLRRMRITLLVAALASTSLLAQNQRQPDWAKLDEETMRHFQAILKIDSTDPPGREAGVVDYVKQVLEKDGIPVQVFAKEAHRPNLVARIKGTGKQRPLLIMGHSDTVNVDPKKWTHPPFGAVRDGGYVYGRGTVDDKDNVVSSLMVMLMLKRLNVRARSRRHLPDGSGRRRQLEPRHPVHGERALRAPSMRSSATPRAAA